MHKDQKIHSTRYFANNEKIMKYLNDYFPNQFIESNFRFSRTGHENIKIPINSKFGINIYKNFDKYYKSITVIQIIYMTGIDTFISIFDFSITFNDNNNNLKYINEYNYINNNINILENIPPYDYMITDIINMMYIQFYCFPWYKEKYKKNLYRLIFLLNYKKLNEPILSDIIKDTDTIEDTDTIKNTDEIKDTDENKESTQNIDLSNIFSNIIKLIYNTHKFVLPNEAELVHIPNEDELLLNLYRVKGIKAELKYNNNNNNNNNI